MPFARQCAVAPHVAECLEAPTEHWSNVECLQRSRPPGGCHLPCGGQCVFLCLLGFRPCLWTCYDMLPFCRRIDKTVCVCASEGWQKMQPAWASLRLLSHLIHEAIFHLNGTVCETIWMFRCCDMMRCAPCFLSSLMLNSGKDESEDAVDAIIRTASTMRPQTLSVSRPCSRVSG